MSDRQITWEYSGVSLGRWERIQEVCRNKYGITITGNNGTTQFMGVKVHYFYSPDSQTGKITLIEKPLILPITLIKKTMDEVFNNI